MLFAIYAASYHTEGNQGNILAHTQQRAHEHYHALPPDHSRRLAITPGGILKRHMACAGWAFIVAERKRKSEREREKEREREREREAEDCKVSL